MEQEKKYIVQFENIEDALVVFNDYHPREVIDGEGIELFGSEPEFYIKVRSAFEYILESKNLSAVRRLITQISYWGNDHEDGSDERTLREYGQLYVVERKFYLLFSHDDQAKLDLIRMKNLEQFENEKQMSLLFDQIYGEMEEGYLDEKIDFQLLKRSFEGQLNCDDEALKKTYELIIDYGGFGPFTRPDVERWELKDKDFKFPQGMRFEFEWRYYGYCHDQPEFREALIHPEFLNAVKEKAKNMPRIVLYDEYLESQVGLVERFRRRLRQFWKKEGEVKN